MNTTPPKSGNIWKGIGAMYSICIKFKPETNWRPYCRQFSTENECCDFVNEAFDKWRVQHVSVFKDGQFLNCFWLSPRLTADLCNLADKMRYNERRLYGNYNFR